MKNMNDEKQMQNVWQIPLCTGAERIKINGKKAHSTQKPEALLYRVILSSSNPGDVVLDPFFGSGTTGAVAKKLNRHFIGIEREPDYVEVAKKRIAAVQPITGGDAVLVTPTARNKPRVRFSQILDTQYLSAGQTVFSADRSQRALVMADSMLRLGDATGSIHTIAALAAGKTAQNGWEYWYYEELDGRLTSIDALRERYRKTFLTESQTD